MKTCKVFFKNGESTEFLDCYFRIEYGENWTPIVFKILTNGNKLVGVFSAKTIAGVGAYEV